MDVKHTVLCTVTQTDPSSTPELCVWLGLGNESTLVMIRERSWFFLKVNKLIVCEATVIFISIKPDHNRSLTVNSVTTA